MAAGLAFLAGLVLGAALWAAAQRSWERRRSLRLGRFFSHAAHEINTPITAINITTLNFISGVFGPMPPDQVKWMEMMREQLGRLNGMVGELRDLIHLELCRDLALQSDSVVPADLVEEALAAVRRGAATSQGDIDAGLPPGLPRVRADRARAIRTLVSLVFHARKFRRSGGLRLTGEHQGAMVALRLEYAGHPISPAEAQRSLDLLYPAARSGHTLNSVGLGLGILRAVARRGGGDLSIQVGPEARTTLCLCLPV
ncbi:MAG: HAMP domain-containing sensor histidine kinase, partial [Elusimicrobia bacterium]|nr:HAMP domain-containing sensor histidine kinase [Elusimicrobiota bacterium]